MNPAYLMAVALVPIPAHAAAAQFAASAAGQSHDSFHSLPVTIGVASISQQVDNVAGTAGIACGDGGTTDTSFYRRFYLAEHGAAASASVSAVTIALRDGGAGANDALPITVNLYTIPSTTTVDTIPQEALTLIGTATSNVSVPGGNVPAAFRIEVSGTVADTAANDLVVEWTNGPVTTVPQFFPANNLNPETHPSFVRSESCNLSQPSTFASTGFDSALMMIVEGNSLPVSLQAFTID